MSKVGQFKLLKQYGDFVKKHPLFGISATSGNKYNAYDVAFLGLLKKSNTNKTKKNNKKGVGMGVGNLLCQTIMYHKEKRINLYKAVQFTAFGFLISVKKNEKKKRSRIIS